jgi:hypothetical protein
MSKRSLAPLVSLLLLVGCNERIVEYREGVNPNDAFHGDMSDASPKPAAARWCV